MCMSDTSPILTNCFTIFKFSKIFTANTNRNGLHRNDLSPVVTAKKIRIYPETWNRGICLRVEFVGCYGSGKVLLSHNFFIVM